MKINNKLTALLILSTMSFATIVKADQIVIPVISKPAVLQEGTQRELTVAQIAELLPWAKDSKIFLIDLMDSTQGLSSTDRLERLVEGLKSVVGESAPKNTELLMRYTINRGLVIVDILNKETSADAVGSVDAKNRVLVSTIKMAIKYYEADMATLSKKSAAPFVTFGLEYFAFLSELNKSIFDASAQYNIQRTSLEWLQWDLYRDLNNTTYAAQIVKINNSLKIFPTKKLTDPQALSYVRQIKGITAQLNFSDMPKATVANNDESTGGSYGSNSGINTPTDKNVIKTFSSPTINGIGINYDSDVTGACKALGYAKGLSKTYAENTSRAALINFDSSGNMNGSAIGYFIKDLTCMGRNNSTIETDVTLITNPELNKIPFIYNEDTDGVCKVLGYARGLPGSANYTEYAETMVSPDKAGNIKAGSIGEYKTLSVICIAKKSQSPLLKATLYQNPTIQGQAINYDSSEAQICKLFGSEGAAVGAKTYAENVGTSIAVGANGNITGSVDGYKMLNLVCIDRR